MANPTSNVFLQANPNYVYVDGDVYLIPQTDEVEGAALGASFSGIGVDNQPHQALLNKANLLRANQLADEAIIRTLQASLTVTSAVGANGWLKLTSTDQNLGVIHPIVQWGTFSLAQFVTSSTTITSPSSFTITFPIAYPHVCWVFVPYFQEDLAVAATYTLEPIVPLVTQNNQVTWASSTNSLQLSGGRTHGLTGIGWIALGY